MATSPDSNSHSNGSSSLGTESVSSLHRGHPAKREPSGGESRVRLGAGLGNEAMQMTSL